MKKFIEINPKIINPRELENRCNKAMLVKDFATETEISAILRQLKNDFQLLQSKSLVKELPLESHRPIIGKFIVFSKKVFRKLTRWLFFAYYNQQNEFNSAVLKTIDDMIQVQEQMLCSIKEFCNLKKKQKIIQVVGVLNFGDAIGNDVLAIDKVLREEGFCTKIYTTEIHKKLVSENVALLNELPDLTENDILIYHAASEDGFMNRFKDLSCKIILWYHNVTPSAFFREWNRIAYDSCENGLRQIQKIKDDIDYAVADSVFNKKDLLNYGYKCPINVIPILIPFADYEKEPDREIISKYDDGYTNFLFVGRMAPNKKIEDIIKQYAYYKKNIDNKCRLFLIGSYNRDDGYFKMLQSVIKTEDISEVIFSGHISFEAILAYYTIADLFLCMSEHEGFCVPLVEAMRFGVPIVAYNCTAIPETLNGAGILVDDKSPASVAEEIKKLLDDTDLKEKIKINQAKNLEKLSYNSVKAQIINFIKGIQ